MQQAGHYRSGKAHPLVQLILHLIKLVPDQALLIERKVPLPVTAKELEKDILNALRRR